MTSIDSICTNWERFFTWAYADCNQQKLANRVQQVCTRVNSIRRKIQSNIIPEDEISSGLGGRKEGRSHH